MSYLATAASIVQFYFVSSFLSRNELGIYGIWMAVAMIASGISSWGFAPVGIRVATAAGSPWRTTVASLASSAVLSIAIISVAVITAAVFHFSNIDPLWLGLAMLSSVMLIFREILLIPCQYHQRFHRIGIIRLVNSLSVATLSVLFAYHTQSASGLVIASVIINTAVFFYLFGDLVRAVRSSGVRAPAMEEIRRLMKEGVSIFFMNMSGNVFNRLDWLLLGMMTSQTVLGGYSVVYRLYELSYQVIHPFTTMLYPRLCKEEKVWGVRIRDIKWKVVCIGALVSIALIVCFPIASQWIWPGKFNDQFTAFAILVSVLPFIYMGGIYYQFFMSKGMQTYLLNVAMTSMLLNAILLFLLIPPFGSAGAAIATAIPQFVQFVRMASAFRKVMLNR